MAITQPLASGRGVPVTLYLRKLETSGEALLARGLDAGEANVFVEEFCVASDVVAQNNDNAVADFVAADLPMIAEQERRHELAHKESRVARESQHETFTRWQWLRLMSLGGFYGFGEQARLGMLSFTEGTGEFVVWLMVVLPFGMKDSLSNAVLFHLFEEVEHGCVTSWYLRRKMWPTTAPATFLPGWMMWCWLFLSPPVVLLLSRPSVLLRSRTLLDLALYFLTAAIVLVAVLVYGFVFWLLPFRESISTHDMRVAKVRELVNQRGITFEVVDKCTYFIN